MLRVRVQTLWTRSKLNIARHLSSSATTVQDAKGAESLSKSNTTEPKPFKDIPGPVSLPWFGSFYNYLPIIGKYNLRKFHDANYQKFLKYGKIVREDLPGNKDLVYIFDAEDIQRMSQLEGKFPKRRPFDSFSTYWKRRLGSDSSLGLFIDEGQKWYDLRSKVQGDLMKLKLVSQYIPAMEDVAMDMTDRIAYLRDHQGEIPDFLQELNKWALETISVVALDTRLGCLAPDRSPDSEPQQMIKATNDMLEETWKLELSLKLWKYFPSPTWRRYCKALDCQSRISDKYIRRAVERLKNKDSTDEEELTFLEAVLLRDGCNMGLAMRMVQDMILAGVDTTSNTTAFALYELAKNPDMQERMFTEVTNVLPSPGDRLTKSKKEDLHYVRAFLKETLRLYPVIDYNREMTEDIELAGYKIPKGANVVVQNQILSRMEKYFPEANKFKPERWLDREKKLYEPFAYLPFGFGPRMCVGRRIAEQEIIIFLAKVIQRYRLEYHHEDIGIRFRFLNMPDKPLTLKFIDRGS